MLLLLLKGSTSNNVIGVITVIVSHLCVNLLAVNWINNIKIDILKDALAFGYKYPKIIMCAKFGNPRCKKVKVKLAHLIQRHLQS